MSELARVYARWGIEADAKRRATKILADGTRPARDCLAFKLVHNKDHKLFKAGEPAFEAAANDPREPLKGGDADDKILASGATTCSELEIAMKARLGMGLRQVSPPFPPHPTVSPSRKNPAASLFTALIACRSLSLADDGDGAGPDRHG
jgi:hypothetical protein